MTVNATLPFSPDLNAAVRKSFVDWVKCDAYGGYTPPVEGSPVLYSVRHLILRVMSKKDMNDPRKLVYPDVTDLDMRFSDFVKLVYLSDDGSSAPLEHLLRTDVLEPNVKDLVRDARECAWQTDQLRYEKQEQAVLPGDVNLLDKKHRRQWKAAWAKIDSEEVVHAMTDALLPLFWEAMGPAATLRSFFYARGRAAGFTTWSPDYDWFIGEEPADQRTITVGCSMVTIDVKRYPDGEHSTPVKAYNWTAKLFTHPEEQFPDVVAGGVVYILPRKRGIVTSSMADLEIAAGLQFKMDSVEMLALKADCKDLRALLRKGDLCFVSAWERRKGAREGLGRICLETALKYLAERFPTIHSLVFNSMPLQFAADRPEQGEPTDIFLERAAAKILLDNYIRYLKPQQFFDGELLTICCSIQDDNDQVLQDQHEALFQRPQLDSEQLVSTPRMH